MGWGVREWCLKGTQFAQKRTRKCMVCGTGVFTFVVSVANTPVETAPEDVPKANFSGVTIDFLCIFESLCSLLGRDDILIDDNQRLDKLRKNRNPILTR